MTLDQIKTWLNEAARYFESLAPGGEDRAYWSNVANAETARRVEAALVALEAERDMLRTALRPFADAAFRADKKAEETQKYGMGTLTDNASAGLGVTFGHLRAARAAMGEETGK